MDAGTEKAKKTIGKVDAANGKATSKVAKTAAPAAKAMNAPAAAKAEKRKAVNDDSSDENSSPVQEKAKALLPAYDSSDDEAPPAKKQGKMVPPANSYKEEGPIKAVPAAAPMSKTKKGGTTFLPEVGQLVLARWMAGKKEQIPRFGGRSLCGKFFEAEITATNHSAKKASVVYKADNMVEDNVRYINIKLP